MATVTVGCKLPNGIILEVGEKRQLINGANASAVIGGYGLTENVDKEFFDKWMADHADLKFVKAELIFANDKTNNTVAQAKEHADEESGFEGVDPTQKPAGLTEAA